MVSLGHFDVPFCDGPEECKTIDLAESTTNGRVVSIIFRIGTAASIAENFALSYDYGHRESRYAVEERSAPNKAPPALAGHGSC
jgi:hypothetical protein